MNTLTTRARSISTCMRQPAPALPSDQPHQVPLDQYQGTELHPYNGRPGAMDAFDKPSLFMGRLQYRDGTTETAP